MLSSLHGVKLYTMLNSAIASLFPFGLTSCDSDSRLHMEKEGPRRLCHPFVVKHSSVPVSSPELDLNLHQSPEHQNFLVLFLVL